MSRILSRSTTAAKERGEVCSQKLLVNTHVVQVQRAQRHLTKCFCEFVEICVDQWKPTVLVLHPFVFFLPQTIETIEMHYTAVKEWFRSIKDYKYDFHIHDGACKLLTAAMKDGHMVENVSCARLFLLA